MKRIYLLIIPYRLYMIWPGSTEFGPCRWWAEADTISSLSASRATAVGHILSTLDKILLEYGMIFGLFCSINCAVSEQWFMIVIDLASIPDWNVWKSDVPNH